MKITSYARRHDKRSSPNKAGIFGVIVLARLLDIGGSFRETPIVRCVEAVKLDLQEDRPEALNVFEYLLNSVDRGSKDGDNIFDSQRFLGMVQAAIERRSLKVGSLAPGAKRRPSGTTQLFSASLPVERVHDWTLLKTARPTSPWIFTGK